MTKVILYGDMKSRFGETFHFKCKTISEVMRALMANFSDFKSYLAQNHLFYKIIVDGTPIKKNTELLKKIEGKTIKIVPVPIGSGKNVFGIVQAVVGVALIVTGAMMLGTPLAPLGIGLIVAGIGLAAAGVITLLTPYPSFQANEERAGGTNYGFGAISDTALQGDPVPVGYGTLMIPGILIQTKLDSVAV